MKLAGHTMGTPEMTVPEAAALFASLGMEGIEIVCLEGYKSGIDVATDAKAREALRSACAARRLEVICLTPYFQEFNSPDAAVRGEHLDGLKQSIVLAKDLGAGMIRVLAGKEVPPEERSRALPLLVEALREAADFAGGHGVRLAIENHRGTMAITARQTMEVIDAIGRPNVGVLYDQANLTQWRGEDYQEALELQWDCLFHVHLKDIAITDTQRRAKLLGEGMIPCAEIVRALRDRGYDGYICFEYERRSRPDELPEPRTGFAACMEFVAAALRG